MFRLLSKSLLLYFLLILSSPEQHWSVILLSCSDLYVSLGVVCDFTSIVWCLGLSQTNTNLVKDLLRSSFRMLSTIQFSWKLYYSEQEEISLLSWELTIHLPHKAISHYKAITPYNRKINFQDWPSSYPLTPYYHIQLTQMGMGNIRIAYKFRSSYPEKFYKNSVLQKVFKHFQKNIHVGVLF